MKISEILWKAANKHLRPDDAYRSAQSRYSCDAISIAADKGHGALSPEFANSEVGQFVRSLGCHPACFDSFNEFEPGPERQGARYAWLMFASMYAEELGL